MKTITDEMRMELWSLAQAIYLYGVQGFGLDKEGILESYEAIIDPPEMAQPQVGSNEVKVEPKTLRDEFAMAALQGFLASLNPGAPYASDYGNYSGFAYKFADAMLTARVVEGGE